MEVKPVVLQGKHVCLEPMTEEHVPGLTAIGLDEGIWDHMLYGEMLSENDIRSWVQDILSRPDLPFVVIHLTSGRVAGATRYLNIAPEHRGLEIGGTWYGLEFQRTAVNTECKYLLLKHAFETLGCIRVQFKTDQRNIRSQRAIERLGAKLEGVLRNHMIMPDGKYRNSVFYSIKETEWPEIKLKLKEMLVSS
ncbi:MAG: GNAT family N-acetyltransferase [Anaerolineae bacterium]|nr:GNAT family N-acetyltransferase [Anaerolineae bacterium]